MSLIKFILISAITHSLLLWIGLPYKKLYIEPSTRQLEINLLTSAPVNTITNTNSNIKIFTRKRSSNVDSLIKNKATIKNELNVKNNSGKDFKNVEQIGLEDTILEARKLENAAKQTKYYATNEVDIKALPVSNIDTSMLELDFNTNMPIKLRLFINVNGRIDYVERLSVLEQEEKFANKIEDLLTETAFLPARKENKNVDSFQDVEFSFSAI